MKKLILIILFAALLFYSCGAGDVFKKNILNSKSYEIPKDKIWSLALTNMVKKWFVVKSQNDTLYMVQYDYREITVDDMYKYTTTDGGDYVAARYNVFIEIEEDGNNTLLTIHTNYEGLWKEYDPIWGTVSTGFQKLYSNGRFEKEFFDELEKEIAMKKM